MDSHPLRADTILPLLADAAPKTDDGLLLLERVHAWDGSCDVDSAGCAAYASTEFTLCARSSTPGSGRSPGTTSVRTASWQALIAVLRDPASPWWIDVRQPVVGRPKDVDQRGFRPGGSAPPRRQSGRRPAGRGAGCTRSTSRSRASASPASGRWSGTSTPEPGRSAASTARSRTTTTSPGRPTRTRTTLRTCRSASTRSSASRTARLPAYDRHVGPRRGPDRVHDGPERQPVRPPLRRPDRPLGHRTDGSVAHLERGDTANSAVADLTSPSADRGRDLLVRRRLGENVDGVALLRLVLAAFVRSLVERVLDVVRLVISETARGAGQGQVASSWGRARSAVGPFHADLRS